MPAILYATDRGIGKVSGMEVSQKTFRFGLEPGVLGYAIGGLPGNMPSGCSYVLAAPVLVVSAIVFAFNLFI